MERGVTCAVPARLESSRFPRKMLHELFGKPIIVHTLERAAEAGCFEEIFCVTDSEEIAAAAESSGFRFILTGPARNGTERIAQALESFGFDLVVNLQGDEPAFPVASLRRLCASLKREPDWVHTLAHAHPPTKEELADRNRVKAVLDDRGFVTDFLREVESPGRGNRPVAPTGANCRLHLGAYGYSVEYLKRYAALPPSEREIGLPHEILRAPGLAPLRAHPSAPGAPVDVPADLDAALRLLSTLHSSQGATV